MSYSKESLILLEEELFSLKVTFLLELLSGFLSVELAWYEEALIIFSENLLVRILLRKRGVFLWVEGLGWSAYCSCLELKVNSSSISMLIIIIFLFSGYI